MIHHLGLTHWKGYHLCLIQTQDQRVLDQNMKQHLSSASYTLILVPAMQIVDLPYFSKLCGHTRIIILSPVW